MKYKPKNKEYKSFKKGIEIEFFLNEKEQFKGEVHHREERNESEF